MEQGEDAEDDATGMGNTGPAFDATGALLHDDAVGPAVGYPGRRRRTLFTDVIPVY